MRDSARQALPEIPARVRSCLGFICCQLRVNATGKFEVWIRRGIDISRRGRTGNEVVPAAAGAGDAVTRVNTGARACACARESSGEGHCHFSNGAGMHPITRASGGLAGKP